MTFILTYMGESLPEIVFLLTLSGYLIIKSKKN